MIARLSLRWNTLMMRMRTRSGDYQIPCVRSPSMIRPSHKVIQRILPLMEVQVPSILIQILLIIVSCVLPPDSSHFIKELIDLMSKD